MQYYPICLRVEGRPCLVIGGGEVAARKVLSLLKAGARVTIISPTLTPSLTAAATAQRFVHHTRQYRTGDLDGFQLAFAATNDEGLHAIIARDADAAGVLLNVVDRPQLCSFIVPAVVARGDLTVAISTGGASPALAKRLREEFATLLGPEYEQALVILRAVRQRLQGEPRAPEERRDILTALVRSDLLDLLRAGNAAQVDQLLQTTVGDGASVASLGLRVVE